jgi:hypothetical protein
LEFLDEDRAPAVPGILAIGERVEHPRVEDRGF